MSTPRPGAVKGVDLAAVPGCRACLSCLAAVPGCCAWLSCLAAELTVVPGCNAWLPCLATVPGCFPGCRTWLPCLAAVPLCRAWLPCLAAVLAAVPGCRAGCRAWPHIVPVSGPPAVDAHATNPAKTVEWMTCNRRVSIHQRQEPISWEKHSIASHGQCCTRLLTDITVNTNALPALRLWSAANGRNLANNSVVNVQFKIPFFNVPIFLLHIRRLIVSTYYRKIINVC